MSDPGSDRDELEQLKYRYLRALDTKQWDEFESCFVAEATGDYDGLVFGDRAELVTYMRENLGDEVVTMHQVHHPEITIEGDAARMRWYLHDKVIVAALGFLLEGAAFYDDRCVRTSGGWRFSHTGYRRTYETTTNLADLPSFQVKTKPPKSPKPSE